MTDSQHARVDSSVAIANLIAEYARCVDSGDFDALGKLLADCHLISRALGECRGGAAEIADRYRKTIRIYPDGTHRTRHITTNFHLEIDEIHGFAGSRSYFTVLQQTQRDSDIRIICAGEYADRFRRTETAWKFVERSIQLHLLGNLDEHVL